MPHDACIGHRAAFSFCFTLSRIPTAKTYHFVTMYYSHPRRLARSPIAKQNLSHRANVICDGSPSRILSVLRISLGMTTRPSSSILRTIPVAFMVLYSSWIIHFHACHIMFCIGSMWKDKGDYAWKQTITQRCKVFCNWRCIIRMLRFSYKVSCR